MPKPLKTFRVFISSTFADMREERRILQKEVFPKLEKHCESKGAKFLPVDLRWGIAETSQLEQKTIEICLAEVKRCQKISPKPNFLILLGDRYGWQPLPSIIHQFEMNEIFNSITTEEKKIINKWYRIDENALPAEFILQPRDGENIEYSIWEKTEKQIREILRNAVANSNLSNEQKNKYFCSATHLEIINGALNPPKDIENPEKHVFAYVREIEGLPYDQTAKEFFDLQNDMQDIYSKEKLSGLKTQLKERLQDNYQNYKTIWDGKKSIITDPDGFANRILNDLLLIINKQIDETINPNILEHEIQLHEDFKNSLTECFLGRKEALGGISDYINGANNSPYLLYGLSGSGKSSVIAQAIKNAEETNHSAVSVYRFAGTTSTSSGIIGLLKSICRQIAKAYAVDLKELLNDDTSLSENNLTGLTKLFTRCLSFSNDEKPLLIFIDALDQLNLQINLNSLYWLPQTLPSHSKLIVSALPEFADVLTYCSINKLDLLPESDAQKILNNWFRAINRQVTNTQHDEIISRFNINGLPIFLKLAFEMARNWKSYTEDFSLSSSVDGIINNLMDGLEKEHSKDFVQNVVSYMLCGRYQGLTENEILEILVFDKDYWNSSFLKQTHPSHRNELEDVLKIPIVVWSRLSLDIEPYLTERDANGYQVISFFHRQFISTLEKRYLCKPDTQTLYHQRLANYFENYGIESRKVIEMPWQLMQSGQWERLSDTICERWFFNTLHKIQKSDLHIYWTQIEKDSTIKLANLDHHRIIRTLDYEVDEDVRFSWNQSNFLNERRLYLIAIKYLEDLAIYEQEVLPVNLEPQNILETLNRLYINYVASNNWNAAIQICSEITEIENSMPVLIEHSKYQTEEIEDLSAFKKTLLKGALSFGASFSKTILKITSANKLAERAGAIAEILMMQNQTEQAKKWYNYQYIIHSKQKHGLKNIFRYLFQIFITVTLKIYVKIKKQEQGISLQKEIKQHPMFLQPAKEECNRLITLGRVNMLKSKFSKAIKYIKRAQKTTIEYELSKEALECINLLAKVYFEKGDIKTSLEYFEEARRLYESASDLNELAKVYSGMAKCFEQLNDLQNAEKCLVNNKKIFEQLGDTENLKQTFDFLYRIYLKMQKTTEADSFKAQRDAIDTSHLANEAEKQQKNSIFGIEMLLHQLYYNRANEYFESKKYDEAKSILTNLKYKIKTYRPPANTLAGIESLLRSFVKKPGYQIGFILALLQIGLFLGLRWLNTLFGFLHNERILGVYLGAILILVYLIAAFLIEKKNLKKSSFILAFSLIITSILGWFAFTSDDFPVNRFIGVSFFFGFHYIISYVIVSIFKFFIMKIKRFLANRAERKKIKELGLDEMHPFILRTLMKCIRLEGEVYYSGLANFDKALQLYIELENLSKLVGDKICLIDSQQKQLGCHILNKKDLKSEYDLIVRLENSVLQAEKDFKYGVKKLEYELFNSYLTLKHYYSALDHNDKTTYYKEKMEKMRNIIGF